MRPNKRATIQPRQEANQSELSKAINLALRVGGTAMLLSVSHSALSQSLFDPVLELSDLDGTNGFVINGVAVNDRSGISVSGAGDVNGDGVADILVGAERADPNAIAESGASYVVFGTAGLGATGVVELSTLDGMTGFVANGIAADDRSGGSVSDAGDINGDGIDDIIIGARNANIYSAGTTGESYVVFGSATPASSIELSALDGTNGFAITGVSPFDQSGISVSGAGDINGDGVADLIIGAERADPNGSSGAGESYVVFGGIGVGSTGAVELSLLDGINGFVLNGIDAGDRSGRSVSAAGDINGDGTADLIIGAYAADPIGGASAGESYVVFGGAGVSGMGVFDLSTLDGTNGFILEGIDASDESGISVSGAGDINGDGTADLIIGAYNAELNGNSATGETYVVYGGASVGVTGTVDLSMLDGTNGFVINGIDAGDSSGVSVSAAGDINGDGAEDLIIGAALADPNGGGSGESYVVFGGAGVGGTGVLELSTLDGTNGFTLNGISIGDGSGASVSGLGDINSDGADDIIVGAQRGDPNALSNAGESYVIFGRMPVIPMGELCNGLAVTIDLNLGQTPGPGDDVILGTPGNDDIRGRAGNDTICGMGGDDFIHGNSGDDWIDGGDGVDSLRGGQGNDIIYTGSGATVGTSSRAFGGTGDDEIFGGPDADDLRGGRGIDTIDGDGGPDELRGNADDDFLFGGAGGDLLIGGDGIDSCDGEDSLADMAEPSCETVVNVP